MKITIINACILALIIQCVLSGLVIRSPLSLKKYFADKYNMPVGERRQHQFPAPDPDDDGEDKDDKGKKTQKNAHPFFD